MALPILEAVADKDEVQKVISEIATAVFKSAKVSLDSAAKAVIPSVPQMVDDVLEDLKSGSIQKFNLAMDKLDKLVRTLGIDLKKYNKELANFAKRREEKIIISEEKIQTLRENNIIADMDKSGDVRILSQKEIEGKQKDLRDTEKKIQTLENKIIKDTKQIQDPGLFTKELKTTAQANKKEEIKRDTEELEQKKKERDESKQVLGSRGDEQPGVFQRASEGVGNFVDEYVPTPIADVGSAFVEGLMGPINAVKELGSVFGGLLKPLKLLKPLFTGLLGGLKKFALGLKASIVSFLPMIAIAALVGLALFALYKAFQKAVEFFNIQKDGPSESGLGGSQDTDFGMEPDVAAEGDMSSKMQRRAIVDQETKKIIQPDDPSYDMIYERDTGNPAPKKGQVYMGDGETQIMSLNKDGFVNSSSNFMNAENRKNLQVPTGLKPVTEDKKEPITNVSQVNDNSSKVQSDTIIGGGLDGVSNRDFRNHILQTV